jgi:hypothetical protein
VRRLPRLCALALLIAFWPQQAWAAPATKSPPPRAGTPKEVAELAERDSIGKKPSGKKLSASPAYEGVVDVLLQAVALGVPEAARAAGLAVSEAALPRLHEALRGLPLTATLDAYDAALARSTLSEAAKLDVLARLGEIATPATKTFLKTLIAKGRFPLGSPLQRALIETEKRIVPPSVASGGTR